MLIPDKLSDLGQLRAPCGV